MKPLLLFTVCLLAAATANAQWRISGLAGPAFAGNKNKDTAFFAKRHMTEQLKFGFHKGRLGLVVSGAFIQQDPGDIVGDGRVPVIPIPAPGGAGNIRDSASGGRVNTTLFTFGPQLCFPLGPVRLQIHVAGGIAVTKATPLVIRRIFNSSGQGEVAYASQVQSSSTGAVSTGIGLEYFISKKLGISLHGHHLRYDIKYQNRDIRTGGREAEQEQKKRLLGISGGITYKF